MAELIAKSPCDGLLPVVHGGAALTEVAFEAITSVAPLAGQKKAVSAALSEQMGAAFPAPNRTTGKANARLVWTGHGQAFALGPKLEPIEGAAMTDQTDAWACMALQGPAAEDVLARLVPVDVRASQFKRGHTARTLLGHMNVILMRPGADRFGIMVFRSMAATAVHELETAMRGVAARG